MVISFPILVSETVDKDILPYLLKAIERKFALDYMPILQDMIKEELSGDKHLESKHSDSIEGVILEDECEKMEKTHLMESEEFGIQVIPTETNKINGDQPYFLTLRVTTIGRIIHEYMFGFKALALVTTDAYKIFRNEMDDSRYYVHKIIRKMFSDKFIWKMVTWYNKIFDSEGTKTSEWETKKVLFSESKERLCVLSINDVSKEEFETGRYNDTPISSEVLADSRWSGLYLDDSLNKKIYAWDDKTPKFASIITYDVLYKAALGVLPEQIDKAKQKGTSFFSRKIPFNKIWGR